jgi:hypothetical protein
MSPTPASSLHGHARQVPRARRPRNANPYDAAHHWRSVAPPPPPPQASEPTLDEGDDEEDEPQEMDDADGEGDDEEVADVVDITEEIEDGNADGEGAIEEGERGSLQAEQSTVTLQSLEYFSVRLANCSALPVLGSRACPSSETGSLKLAGGQGALSESGEYLDFKSWHACLHTWSSSAHGCRSAV